MLKKIIMLLLSLFCINAMAAEVQFSGEFKAHLMCALGFEGTKEFISTSYLPVEGLSPFLQFYGYVSPEKGRPGRYGLWMVPYLDEETSTSYFFSIRSGDEAEARSTSLKRLKEASDRVFLLETLGGERSSVFVGKTRYPLHRFHSSQRGLSEFKISSLLEDMEWQRTSAESLMKDRQAKVDLFVSSRVGSFPMISLKREIFYWHNLFLKDLEAQIQQVEGKIDGPLDFEKREAVATQSRNLKNSLSDYYSPNNTLGVYLYSLCGKLYLRMSVFSWYKELKPFLKG